ncbi:MAG: hypothetical protein Q8N51_01025 [Gammaproteobacteria bacterium]|nr:hypothetical protein [Gammaproteobacteria bacterium]
MLLRSILGSQPKLRRCRTRCRHCRIFFLTHPSNAGRWDLGCPFGCREAHRKRASSQRSAAYYRDEPGKLKKRFQNAKRRKSAAPPAVAPPPGEPLPWPRPIVEYVRMVTSLIEGRWVSLTEVLAMLARAMRQHTMGRMRRIDQVVAWLNEWPP